MAIGDVIASSLIANVSGYLNLKPSGTEQWVIHNIAHQSDAELFINDNLTSTNIMISKHVDGGAWVGYFLHCTPNLFYRVRNTDSNGASGKMLTFDGIITHL
jgi:hypothetical protein